MRKWAVVLASGVAFGGICEEVDISKHVPVPPYKVESKREVYGLCEMILNINGQLVPVYVSRDFLLAGEMYADRKPITQLKLEEVRKRILKENLAKLETLVHLKYRPENVKEGKYFYFISDPDCPFCQRVKGKVKELADKYGYEIRVIWYPLPFHPEAKGKAIRFYCEGRTYEDYINDLWEGKECEEGRKEIEKALRVLRDFVRGTPTFVFPDGEVVVGADITRLEEVMKR